jgi:glyoxylase-like metal-dependent hydrolase (beta-lactamase superfamily II)
MGARRAQPRAQWQTTRMGRSIDYEHGITAIDAEYQRPGLAAFYLLVEGKKAAFIDTGTSLSVPHALEVLRRQELTPEDVAYVIPTHVHLDHAGGAGEMMRRFPNARLVVHPRGARHLIDPGKLIAGVAEVYGAEAAARHFGNIAPIPAERVIEAPDNFVLDLGGRELLFLDTPGHARHHFCVWDERSRGVFSGDTFGISYREFDTDKGAFIFPTTTPVQFEPDALHVSIDRLVALRPAQIYLTHFARVTDDARRGGGSARQGAGAEIARLASDMHELVTAFADMARGLRDAGPTRHARLIQGQRDILRPRLAAHGCRFDPDQFENLLAGDYSLNAQGLGVWLDREAAT